MSKKKLLGFLTGLLTLGGVSPAFAYGEWFSGGFVTPNCKVNGVSKSTMKKHSLIGLILIPVLSGLAIAASLQARPKYRTPQKGYGIQSFVGWVERKHAKGGFLDDSETQH